MEQSAAPFASVIIPVFNDSHRLRLCLAKLNEQDYPTDYYEVIVIDKGSKRPPSGIETELKNCRLLFESQPGSYAARNRGVSLKLLLLGGAQDDCLSYIERRIKDTNSAERIQWLGVVQDTERYYAIMDFTINSRIDAEPFGISVIESMLMGTPVLVHALGGPAETVIDGATGWHLQEASVESFSDGISPIADRPKWPSMRQHCRQRAMDNFGTPASVNRYLSVLAE